MSAPTTTRAFALPGTALILLLALSACQATSPELESMSPEAAGETLGDVDAMSASEDVPSELSDATGEMEM
ncbi:hypothetical protein [Tropicimonas sp. IMCC6043]|uniref:hypothetical protein n=1 Tax=Tropicimonas sp. IMCC6043 TaxID=2510645 RepID=UPI00101D8C1D|nr:hypothetical protein [Tropicimonas sp. IMCC6043]RYH11825.1 hypothetical protein EU800_04115 [Tropicimonas sp. IMCC6043]